MRIVLLFLLGCSAIASEINHLGTFSFRSKIFLEPSTNRSDLIGFEIKLYPLGNITNGISFHKTNNLIIMRDIPLVVPGGFTVMSASPVHSDNVISEETLYSFHLNRPNAVSVKAVLVELDDSLPPLPPDVPRRVMMDMPSPLPTESTAYETFGEAMRRTIEKRTGLRRNE